MPRGRAPGYDSQREQILARAAELFARQGYSATSMNQVALACGVSKPSLYHYVRDKYQLLVEIAEDHVGRLKFLVTQLQERPLEPHERVRELIGGFLDIYADAQPAHRVLTEDVKFLRERDRKHVLDVQREVVEAFAQAIAELRPELSGTELHKPVTMLLFGMMNWMFTWFQAAGKLSHAVMAPIIADLFLGGLNAVRLPHAKLAGAPTPATADPDSLKRRA